MTTAQVLRNQRQEGKKSLHIHIERTYVQDSETKGWQVTIEVIVEEEGGASSHSPKMTEETEALLRREQEQIFLALGTHQGILCPPEKPQPEPQRPDLPTPVAKGLLTKSFQNYHVLAEKLANESLLLSLHQVCRKDSEIAKKVESHYLSAEGMLKTLGEWMELWDEYGQTEEDPDELGLLVVDKQFFTNIVRSMKEKYNIASTPALDEAYVEMQDRIENLKRLKQKERDFIFGHDF